MNWNSFILSLFASSKAHRQYNKHQKNLKLRIYTCNTKYAEEWVKTESQEFWLSESGS